MCQVLQGREAQTEMGVESPCDGFVPNFSCTRITRSTEAQHAPQASGRWLVWTAFPPRGRATSQSDRKECYVQVGWGPWNTCEMMKNLAGSRLCFCTPQDFITLHRKRRPPTHLFLFPWVPFLLLPAFSGGFSLSLRSQLLRGPAF